MGASVQCAGACFLMFLLLVCSPSDEHTLLCGFEKLRF